MDQGEVAGLAANSKSVYQERPRVVNFIFKPCLIEIVTVGAYAKVSAIDSATGTEVFITGPANADRATLEAAAIQKLELVLKKPAGKS